MRKCVIAWLLSLCMVMTATPEILLANVGNEKQETEVDVPEGKEQEEEDEGEETSVVELPAIEEAEESETSGTEKAAEAEAEEIPEIKETEVLEAAETEEIPETEFTQEDEEEIPEQEEIQSGTEEIELTLEEEEQLKAEVSMEVSALYAADLSAGSVTEKQLYLLAPSYLVNEPYDKIIAKCGDMSLEAINSVSETDAVIASYMYGLKQGSSFLWNELWASCGLTDSAYQEFEIQAAKEVLCEYLQVDENLSKASDEVESTFNSIDKVYDLTTTAGKNSFKEIISKNNPLLTESQVNSMVDGLFEKSDTIMKYAENAEEFSLYIMAFVEMQMIEIQALDDLIVIHNQVKDPAMRDALAKLRTEITTDIGTYIVNTYVKEKVLENLEKEVKEAVKNIAGKKFQYSALAWKLGKLVTGTVASIYEKYRPSVSDIVYSSILYQYWTDSNMAVAHYQHLFRMGKGTENDIRYCAAALNFNAVCTKLLLAKSKNLVKNSNKRLYSKMDCWESSMGSEVNYELYMNSCLANASQAVQAGTLVITQDSATMKDENGTVIDKNYDSTESIKAKFAAIQKQYKPNVGQTWNDDWGGAIQCFGFARMVFYKLYGCNMPNRYVSAAKYKYQSEENVDLIGQISGSNVTAASAKSLLQQGKLGDIIQACGANNGGQHTMIFVSADDSGVTVYDCNTRLNVSEPACVIHQWTINWNSWASYYGTGDSSSENGISLYRASNYAQIYGNGDGMFYDDSVNFVIENGVLTKYNGWQTFVEIPDSVTAIGDEAFKNNTTMMSVNIPDGVKSIGKNAFYGCTALLGVVLPDSVETIGGSAFWNCSKLASAYLPMNEKFTVIDDRTFYGCGALQGIVIPDNVMILKGSAFQNCKKLKTVKLSKNLERLGSNTFGYCSSLESIEIPKSLDIAGDDSLTSYSSGAFCGCENLKKVSFEEGTTEIAYKLFSDCIGLEEIVLPDTITTIEGYAFYGCNNLTTIKMSNNLTVIEEGAFEYCTAFKILTLPDGLTEIKSRAFMGCSLLSEIKIPDSVIKIGGSAFQNCQKLRKVELSKNLERLGSNTFGYCNSLESIEIPKSLDIAGDDSLTSYSSGAFYGCENLKKVSFEEGTTEIAYKLFSDCIGLEEIVLPDTITTIEEDAFWGCINLKTIDIGNGLNKIEGYAFYNCTSLTQVTLPDTVTSMGTSVFNGCTSLTEVHLPNTRENLMESTFYNCKKLTTVNFPSTLKNIQSNAFYGCESLTEAILPSGLEKIENNAFQNCKALKKAVVPDSVTTIGSNAFYGCESLTDITLGSSLKSINSQTFYGCTTLPSIVIPYYVTSIGDSAFVNCTKLTQVTVPRKTTSIASNAFSYPKKMTMYGPSGSYAQEYAAQKGIKFVAQDIAATSVSLNVTEKTLERYDSFWLVASITPQNFTDEIVWTSSDEKVVTVSEDGYVEACGGGQAVITVTVGAVQASCTVTVEQLVDWIEFTDDDVEMEAGETRQLHVKIHPENATNKELEYTSSNPDIAEISASGLVTAKKKGETRIKAAAKDGSGEYDTCYVTVTGEAKVAGISLNKTSAVVKKGETLTLQANIIPDYAANKKVTWKSSNENVAAVDSKGKVTGKTAGKTTITVTSSENSSYKATCTITVPYNITYKLNKGKNNSQNPEYYYNQSVTLKNPTRKGYLFKGWYTDKKYKSKIKTISKDAKKDYTLYAKWEKIKVAKTSVTSAKNSKSKQILLKYKKVSGAKGYEISYSTDKKFKKAVTKKTTKKTSYTIKKLKEGKIYYVRVRAYKVDSAGKKVYGKYSSVKKVKIKK